MNTDVTMQPQRAEWDLVANISLLFAELPLFDRIPAAVSAGFGSIEAWWPFPDARAEQQTAAFLDAIERTGTRLTGLNFFAGDIPGGERGIVSRPDRQEEFVANVDVIVEVARRTGALGFNALYGQRQPGMDPAEQDRVGFENLVLAGRKLESVGGTVLIEPLSRGMNGDYPIETAEQGVELVNRLREAAGLTNIALLFDTFHLASNDEDLVAVIDQYVDLIGHVQLADAPGRGAPGTGAVDFVAVLEALARAGYDGMVACEYVPGRSTGETLDWVADTPHVRLNR